MRTPLVVTSILLGLALGATATTPTSPLDKKTVMTSFDELTMFILEIAGTQTLIADEEGKIDFHLNIDGKDYPLQVNVGIDGRMQLSLEEVKDASGKNVFTVVLRFDRPDKDNASIMFTGLAPKLKQIPFVVKDGIGFGGAIYTGNIVCDQVVDSGILNRFSHDGGYGQMQTGPMFYIAPKYDADGKTASGTRGIFISPNPLPADFGSVGIVIGLAEWEQ